MQKPFIRQQIRLFILGICIVSFLIVFGRPTTAQSANSIERVSVGLNGAESNGNSNNGFQSSISADGRYVAFTSSASDLVNGATNGLTFVYVYDRQTKQMSQVSVPPAENETQMGSFLPSISADGRYVAFCRAGGYYNYAGCLDVYVHDMQTGQNTLASV